MPSEPTVKRTFAFVDGQNLFYAAKKAFGYPYPNYDPKKLAERICTSRGWNLTETFFYTGIPDATDNPFWNHFWTAKLAVMGTRGVQTFSRSLRYRTMPVSIPMTIGPRKRKRTDEIPRHMAVHFHLLPFPLLTTFAVSGKLSAALPKKFSPSQVFDFSFVQKAAR